MESDVVGSVKRLGGQSAFFLLGSVFTLVVGWPLQIYVARVIGADGLGVFSLMDSVTAIAAGLLGFGVAPTVVRFIPEYLETKRYDSIRQLLKVAFLVVIFSGILGLGLLTFGRDAIQVFLPSLAAHDVAFLVMALFVPITLLSFVLQQGLRGLHEIRFMVVGSSFLQLTIKATLAVVLLTSGYQLLGYVWSVVLSAVVGCAWMAVGLKRRIASLPAVKELEQHRSNVAAWSRYAQTMYSNSLLTVTSGHLDRFLLGFYFGPGPIGILAVVRTLQQLPAVFLQMLIAVVAPMFSGAFARGDTTSLNHLYHVSTDWLVRLSAPLLIFLFLFAGPMLGVYGAEFSEKGRLPLTILVLAQSVNLVAGPIGSFLNMTGCEREMLRLSLASTVIKVTALIALVRWQGLMGATVAIAISMAFLNFAALRLAKRRRGLYWSDRRYLRWIMPCGIALSVGVALRVNQEVPSTLLLAADLILLYVVFHGVSLLQGLHDDDRLLVEHWYRRIRAVFAK